MIRRKKRDLGGIPTSSMSDVAFLLLIFFLSTTKFDTKKGLGLVLPAMAKNQENVKRAKIKDENLTKITIKEDGSILLKTAGTEEQLAMKEVQAKVKRIITKNPQMVISLKTERRAKYNYMVQVLDRLQAAGASKISLSTN
ncbi:MAG: biopolymer transporter ExbD [Candidatus Cloacimonetes bacterium]|nr:biopolymer transporter ExbD [Candidatus Cloacimonadota bacterium]